MMNLVLPYPAYGTGVLRMPIARRKAKLVYHRMSLTNINLLRFIMFPFVYRDGNDDTSATKTR
jgi:hypothetical protein